ncbi:MAG: folylpolyglutamate synthase/dihydrofolate synthase family protein [Rikenellaceae bacterium]|nr:folylpolyglutamate synthase/dihydrofolate synthase family protein [Rikenellaceae bacterium]
MNYTQTLEFLFNQLPVFEKTGASAYKPGLERISEFCRVLGNPQRNFFTIHVAGTNGKGSVSHMLASILEQAGYRTGLFTSPHLKDFRERIRVDGEMIPKQKVVNFVDKHREKMVDLKLSFFEMTAALAFDYFAQSDVEVAVIETGLGGRLDATNVIVPIVSIITNIGLEHTALLGDTHAKIAAEKGGIIKKSIPVIIGEGDERYNSVIEAIAAENRSRVIYAEQEFICEEANDNSCEQCISLRRVRDQYLYDVRLDLMGHYQRKNLVTVATVADFLHESTPLTISRRAFIEGLQSASKQTSLLGRWQVIGENPLTICDTGHNAHGIRYVAEQLGAVAYEKCYCVMGFVRDKALPEILPLLPTTAHYIFTAADTNRAVPAAELCELAAGYGLKGEVVEKVEEAVARARELATEKDLIFIGGSTYVVGEAM